MDPAEYEASYHQINFVDWKMGLFGVADITRYISAWPKGSGDKHQPPHPHDNYDEYIKVLTAVSRALGLKGWGQVPARFQFKGDVRVDPNEDFFQMTIRRAFEGRASPDEIRDTIRIAYLVGMITFPVEASAYAAKYFGIDCNSFVGNYLGISPYVPIRAYAHGFGSQPHIQGATTDIYTCRGCLPLAPVADIDSIKPGTVIVTFGDQQPTPKPEPGKPAPPPPSRWRHIGLVQSFVPIMSPGLSGARNSGMLSIAEWGTSGGSAAHVGVPKKVVLQHFKCSELPGKTFLAFSGQTADYGPGTMRMFFDGAKFDSFSSRGWHVCNAQGAEVADG